MREHKLSLSTAESCTGGLIAAQITSVPGASEVYPGGIVSYSNAMKMSQLGVNASSLETYGAVSETVAKEMATGALVATQSDLAIAVTGIAGPGGGSEEKPVGTVWIAWGRSENLHSVCLQLPFDRQGFQLWVAALAQELLRREVLGISGLPSLVQRYRRGGSI